MCCRSRLLLATLSGTGRAFRHLIGRNCPRRPRPLEAAGARGRGGSPRSPDRARWAAERGAGRRTGAGRAGGRGGGREGPGAERGSKGADGAEVGAWPRLPRAVPVLSRRGPLGDSICQRLPLLSPPPAGPDSAGGGRGAGAARPSAVRRVAERPRAARDTQRRR